MKVAKVTPFKGELVHLKDGVEFRRLTFDHWESCSGRVWEFVPKTVDLEVAYQAFNVASVATIDCGCDPATGHVCQTCACMAEKNVTELADYVNDFIRKRFPAGLEGDIRRIITECILDSFHDGARWAEKTAREEQPLLIMTDGSSNLRLAGIKPIPTILTPR